VQKFYFNGVLQADTQNRANTAFEYYSIGKSVGSSSDYFYEGFLDEFAHFSTELSATEVSELFNGGMALDARDHSEASNLEGYWRNNGTDEWTDLSEYGNDGTVNGSPTTIQLQEVPYFGTDSLGLPMNKVREGGLNFDKTSYAKISHDASLIFDGGTSSDGVTVELWYKARSVASYDANQYLVASESWSNTGGISLLATATDITWTCEKADTPDPDAEAKFTHSDSVTWVHVVATYDESNLKLYKNSALDVSSQTFATTTAIVDEVPNDIYIGSLNGGGNFWCDGIIDDVKIYNRALIQAEVTKNYKKGLSAHKATSTWSDDL
jgi:hypothetical protein